MQRKYKILAVDDNETNLSILEIILQEDYILRTAVSGEQALAMVQEFKPDLVLLDVMMDGIDGYETCRKLRETDLGKYLKIIMVSAKAMVSERLKGYEAGADDYVTKPFEESELLAKLKVYLHLKAVEEVDRIKSEVLTLLSDEQRTPLNNLIGPAKLLLDHENLDMECRREFLQLIHDSAQELHQLISDVISFSALKSNRWQGYRQLASMPDIVQSAIAEMGDKAEQKQIDIRTHFDPCPLLELDGRAVMRAVMEILDNAIGVSPDGSKLEVAVHHEDDHIVVNVVDRGPGIRADILPHIFEEFVSTDQKGMGLGLALARQIVMLHGGKIDVDSSEEGTVFRVHIPISVSAEEKD